MHLFPLILKILNSMFSFTVTFLSKFLFRFSLIFAGVSAAQAANILLVTDDNTQTQSLNDFLVSEGHTVTRDQRANGPGDVSSFQLVIVARETNSGDYDDGTEPADWNGLSLPIINMAPHVMRSIRWGWVNGNNLPALTLSSYDSPFLNASHPIVQGTTTSILNPGSSATGVSNPLPAGTEQIAAMGNGASHGIFVIPTGASFFGNRGTAGDVRIGFLRGDTSSWDNASTNGKVLLSNAINWVLGTVFGPPTLVNSPATNLLSTSATIGGGVSESGGSTPEVTIYYGDNDGGANSVAWDSSVDLGSQGGTFSTALSGLTPGTIYYFRAYGRSVLGNNWADSSASFTTLPPPDLSPLIINEFLASNDGTYANFPNPNQVAGQTEDWIEILNVSNSPISLDGWYLTDDSAVPTLWPFPSGSTISAGGFLLLYASGTGVPDANGNLHTNFRLSAGGEYFALVSPDLTIASAFNEDGSDYPRQTTDISYGIHPVSTLPVFFSNPTPGAPNDQGSVAPVADTTFSVNRGIYSAPFQVEIATLTPAATIYFTTDGNPPIDDAGSPINGASIYSGPVSISQTTILRAAAVRTGFAATNIDTQTYLLVDVAGAGPNGLDPGGLNAVILEQTRPTGFPSLSSGDYNMDQDVSKSTGAVTSVSGLTEAQALIQSLVEIPTLSIAMEFDDFAGAANGIYTNSLQSGFAWERACSAEWIKGDSSKSWQENCGIRVQGGSSRTPSRSPKHGLSLRFRETYGVSKLRENLFPESDVDTFDTLALRAGYNNSWIHSNIDQRNRGSMIRDQWARSTMLDMGNPEAGHGMMVHLYVNGLYWGVHNLTERQNASHYAEHNGGDDDLIDARNGAGFVDGNSIAWDAMRSVVASRDWAKIQQVLDVDTHIDYQIVNGYGGNSDLAPHNNWRAAGGGPFPPDQPELMVPWQIYAWDTERTLEDETSILAVIDPAEIRDTLLTITEYRIRFADRLQKHFFNGGAMTPVNTTARWLEWAGVLDLPIIAESARWGDHRGNLFDRDGEWLTEQRRMINIYFPARTANVLQTYQTAGIFPDFETPEFRVGGSPQHGGRLTAGTSLSLVASEGTIYYTIDGSDPRLEGGGLSPSALAVSSESAITLSESALVRTRAISSGEWSTLNEAVFFIGLGASSANLVISEVMYHPASELEEEEYLVLMNISETDTIDLSSIALDDGVNYTFPLGSVLGPLERVVITGSQASFNAAFPQSVIPLAVGEFTGSLSNAGEAISLVTPEGNIIQLFTYDDVLPWPETADGGGFSMVLVSPSTGPDHALPGSWQAGVPLANTDYDLWAGLFPGIDLSDPEADFDGDGVSNQEELIFGLDPTNPSSVNPYLVTPDAAGTFTYTRRNPALSGLTYRVQTSPDLETWTDDSAAIQLAGATDGNDVEAVSVTLSAPLVGGRFFVQILAEE